jgi:hypothetical protein
MHSSPPSRCSRSPRRGLVGLTGPTSAPVLRTPAGVLRGVSGDRPTPGPAGRLSAGATRRGPCVLSLRRLAGLPPAGRLASASLPVASLLANPRH